MLRKTGLILLAPTEIVAGDLAAPEHVIVRKVELHCEDVSPRHLRDIRPMLDVSAKRIDVATIEDRMRRRGLILSRGSADAAQAAADVTASLAPAGAASRVGVVAVDALDRDPLTGKVRRILVD